MRRFLAVGLMVWACGGPSARAEGPTYHKDVAAIVQENCQDCHRPGQVAPFSLLTFEQARKRAGDIAHVTEGRIMPPWPASSEVGGPFRDRRVLSDQEKATLRAWAEAGCPEGDPADAPPARSFASDWPLGPPDLVLTMPEAYRLNAEGDDDFRAFVLPTNFPEDRWVRAVDFQAGNRKVVHHIIATFDTSGKARELDAKDPGPGYAAINFGEGVPLRGLLPIWTPGSTPRYAPEGAGYLLPAGADVLLQLHYHKSGKVEEDATSIGLYLSDAPMAKKVNTGFLMPEIGPLKTVMLMAKVKAEQQAGRRPRFEDMMREVLTIPAGEARYEVKGSSRSGFQGRPLSRDVLLTAVMPHMHWLGKDFAMTAVLPDGTRRPLIDIGRWNFNWQGTYAFEQPIFLPKGSWFEMLAHFDNSDANPFNPSHPPKEVSWGNQTNDEMCIGVYEFINAEDPSPAPKAEPSDRSKAGQD